MNNLAKITLTKKNSRLLSGHVWVYRSDLDGWQSLSHGELVDLHDPRGKFLGRGYVNPLSEITFRLLTRNQEAIDLSFFKRRLVQAKSLREQSGLSTQPHRLLFSEADLLPGFIVDVYDKLLVASLTTAGADNLKKYFLEALESVYPNHIIYERSDNTGRIKEGLTLVNGFLKGECASPLRCELDSIPVNVDFIGGQKTGLYLDARTMRRDLALRAKGMKVLDCFANVGLFARYALKGGAQEVTVIETDPQALESIRKEIPEAIVVGENVFDVLRNFKKESEFDIIVLDPPAFAKDRRSVEGALRGYKEINLRALKMLKPGGLLYTSSCSYHVSRDYFLNALCEAADDAKKNVRLLQSFQAGADHPVVLNIPETNYFKGFLLQVIE